MLPGYAAQRGRVQLAPDQQHVQKAKPQLVILLNLFERKTKPYQAILNKPIRLRLGEAFLCEIRKSERGVVTPYTSFSDKKGTHAAFRQFALWGSQLARICPPRNLQLQPIVE